MKQLYCLVTLLTLLASSVSDSLSQNYNGQFRELYFGRQPSARAEAMGRGLSAVTGDALSYYWNPAGMAGTKGLNLTGSYAKPYYNLDDASYNYFSASYNFGKYGTAGLSRDYFDYGIDDDIVITDEYGNYVRTETYDPDLTTYRLSYSAEVMKGLFAGTNLNLLHVFTGMENNLTVGNEQGSGGSKDIFYFDLGVIKSFDLKSKGMDHKVNLGSSLVNVNFAEYSTVDESQADPLPVIFRLGAAYELSLDDRSISSKLKSYNFLVNLEYEDLFNSKYYSGFHGGLEFTFLEIVSLRAGYFTSDNRNATYDTLINGIREEGFSTNEFTYGFGVNIPVRQLTDSKTPLEIKFDFVSLKQPPLNEKKDDWKNFQVYTLIINWIF